MKVSQLITNNILSSNPNTLPGKVKEKVLLSIRNFLYENKDILVNYSLNGKTILLPVWHDLPTNRKIFPLYSENLGRIAAKLAGKYKNLCAIDIGANIGDSVFIIKSFADIPILCIEGNEYFFSILKKNIQYWSDVCTEQTFVGDRIESKGSYSYSKGSGRIIETENSSENIRFESLHKIITKYPQFEKCKLIKIDTDGFDCRIIRSSLDYLEKSKPVLFFEYDPYLLRELNDDGLSTFDLLLKRGYNLALFYDNNSDYLLCAELNQKNLLEDIHNYYSGRNTERYCDICIFHSDDNDTAFNLRKEELKFFAVKRNF